MGYISSGVTNNIEASLTQRGREILSKSKSDFNFYYFALGDSDANYLILNPLDKGFVPDFNGNNDDCVSAVAQNIDIKYKIIK